MKRIFFLLCLLPAVSQAQDIRYSYVARPDSVLNLLVGQREDLYKKWSEDQQERNAFFGGQSKNDLRNIIATMEKILKKDNEILAELNRMKNSEVAELRRKNSDINQRVNTYLGESGALMEENRQLKDQLERNRRRLDDIEEQSRRPFQITAGLLVMSWVGFFLVWRRVRKV